MDIARLALRDNHTRLAHFWSLEALHRLASGKESEELKPQILAVLVEAKAALGDYRGLNETYQELVKIQPASAEYARNYESFREASGGKIALIESKAVEEHPVSNFYTYQ